jgi:hypothetical protein
VYVVDFLVILLVLLSLITILGHVWLSILAFKQSPMWGLSVFFFPPIAAMIFARRHWEIVKGPILVHVTVFCLCVGLAVFLADSSIGVQLSRAVTGPELLNLDVISPKPTHSEETLENLAMLGSMLEDMSQQSEHEAQTKFIRLISEYIHYTNAGFTDRSRRYILRNITELLLLPELKPEERIHLLKLKKDLEGEKVAGMTRVTVSPLEKVEQRVSLTLNESLALKVSDIPRNPAAFQANSLVIPPKRAKSLNRVIYSPAISLKKTSKDPGMNPGEAMHRSMSDISSTKKISFWQAKQYIGSRITFLNLNDVEQSCFLTDVSKEVLECEKRFPTGQFSSQYTFSEVRFLKVYRR